MDTITPENNQEVLMESPIVSVPRASYMRPEMILVDPAEAMQCDSCQ